MISIFLHGKKIYIPFYCFRTWVESLIISDLATPGGSKVEAPVVNHLRSFGADHVHI